MHFMTFSRVLIWDFCCLRMLDVWGYRKVLSCYVEISATYLLCSISIDLACLVMHSYFASLERII